MKRYTFSDMNRASSAILEAALMAPVTLTKRGEEKVVILSAAEYRKLVIRSRAVVYSMGNAPDDKHSELMSGLDAIIAGATHS